ncbi:hypothetical protein SDC9_167105 [bioreactor metagenome]|uniref:Uncharacterized protein n=1 Tax=bioreactor metagenome TaxID=1076179 RepID=A0A645G720_9ZZZZ
MRLVDLHILAGGLLVVRSKGLVVVLVELARHVIRDVQQRVRLGRSQAAGSNGHGSNEGLERAGGNHCVCVSDVSKSEHHCG